MIRPVGMLGWFDRDFPTFLLPNPFFTDSLMVRPRVQCQTQISESFGGWFVFWERA